ncbi:heterogeneous nuclear ribonucleoprotein 87F-like [Drosophila subpulchrella]|uniref:heterogeneous nuclear ribonucleoprotein 87F-like n=1 Tax=Drosophila subpulchrella TaxID=1486046 RepID=UPI0018A1B400|nr:heterogeneous nuclear ribonucleoprotein 87F-like [Drosophila subpulchrella]
MENVDSKLKDTNETTEEEQLRKLFVSGLAFHSTDESLGAHFARFGTIVEAVVMKNTKNRRSRGFGFVIYTQSLIKDNAMTASPHLLDGTVVDVKEPYPRQVVDPDEKAMLWLQRRRHQRRQGQRSHPRHPPRSNGPKKTISKKIVR